MLNLPKAKEYVAMWKTALSLDNNTIYKYQFADWFYSNKSGKQIKAEFRTALHRRINARGGEEWRNIQTQKEIEMYHDQWNLHNWIQKRIICCRLTTPKLQKRFAHLLWSED